MKRIKRFFRKPAVHVFLFFLFFVSLNWPFITIPESCTSGTGVWTFLLLTTSLLVIVLFLVSLSLPGKPGRENTAPGTGELDRD